MNGILSVVFASAVLLLPGFAAGPAFAAKGDCGQPQSNTAKPTTGDALAALRRSVLLASACDAKPCLCDVNADGKVATSDALRILRVAVSQNVTLTCDCGPAACTTVGGSAAAAPASLRAVEVATPQIQLDVKLIGMHKQSYVDLGLDFGATVPITTDAGPAPGGTNGDGRTLAVRSNATGGPPDLQYLVYGMHRAAGALPILNKNFVSPFTGVKTFPLLPTTGCVLFEQSSLSVPQNFPGVTPVDNLAATTDSLLNGGQLLYDLFTYPELDQLLGAIQGDNRNTILAAPVVRVHPDQALLHMADDVQPTLSQIDEDFRAKIQAVTPAPFGNFTGVTLDVTAHAELNGNITLQIRPGTQSLSFFFSTAFTVDGTQVDAEIPLHRRGRNVANIQVTPGTALVVGGLLRMGEQVPDKGLPVLGNLPLIGSLFTHKHLNPATQNLLIVITPTMVDAD